MLIHITDSARKVCGLLVCEVHEGQLGLPRCLGDTFMTCLQMSVHCELQDKRLIMGGSSGVAKDSPTVLGGYSLQQLALLQVREAPIWLESAYPLAYFVRRLLLPLPLFTMHSYLADTRLARVKPSFRGPIHSPAWGGGHVVHTCELLFRLHLHGRKRGRECRAKLFTHQGGRKRGRECSAKLSHQGLLCQQKKASQGGLVESKQSLAG